MIQRNRAPYGAKGNFLFGLATLLDGLIRTLTLGFYHSNHSFTPLEVSKKLTKTHFAKLKAQREAQRKSQLTA